MRRARGTGRWALAAALAGVLRVAPGCQQVTGLSDLNFDGDEAPEAGGASGSAGQGEGGAGAAGEGGEGGVGGVGGAAGGVGGAGGASGVAGAAGTAGSSGAAQGGGEPGGGGQGGAPVCEEGNVAPVASVGSATPAATVGQEFTLDASTSSDPEGGGLLFAWEPLEGAPAPADADQAKARVTVSECGTYSYRVTVTDGCGATAQTEVTVSALAGVYVRQQGCDPSVACGGQQAPWCEVQAAIEGTSGAVVLKVAPGSYAAVTLRDGVTIEGGYADDFASRDASAATNGTVITSAVGPAVSGALAGEATVDGVTMTTTPTAVVAELAAVRLRGQGALTLRGVVAPGGALAATPGRACAVWRPTEASGALIVEGGSVLVASRATARSAGLCLEGTGPVVLDQMTARGGVAADSAGLDASFDGKLVVTGSTIEGSDATGRSSGLRFVNAQPTAGATVSLTGTTVRGGRGSQTYGVEVQRIGQLAIEGGEVRGETPAGPGSPSAQRGVGVWASQLLGVDAAEAVTIENVTIEGATAATERVGVLLDSTSMRLSQGQVDGSQQAGGRRAVGVRVEGAAAAAGVTIEKVSRVGGGSPAAAQVAIEAYGIELASATPAVVRGNTLVVGCVTPCAASVAGSLAAGVRVQQGQPSITKNQLILGGAQQGTGAARHLGVWGQKCQGQGCVTTVVEVTSNNLVAGNTDATRRPTEAVGVALDGVRATVTGNKRVQGGQALLLAAGIDAVEGKGTVVSRNVLAGGSGQQTYGLRSARQNQLVVDANTADACGLIQQGDKADAVCQQTLQAAGLQSLDDDGARLSNNLAFGGYGLTSSGCILGNGFTGSQTGALFVYNLCLAVGRAKKTDESTSEAAGLRLVGSQGQKARGLGVQDNLLLVANRALERYAVVEGEVVGLVLTHNDLWLLSAPPTLGPGLALYRRGATEFDTLAGLEQPSGSGTLASNLTLAPVFKSLDVDALTVDSLFAPGTCTFDDQGTPVATVTTDFGGHPRGSPPALGPFECQ